MVWFFALAFTFITFGIYNDMRVDNFAELVEHIGVLILYVMMWNYEVRKVEGPQYFDAVQEGQ